MESYQILEINNFNILLLLGLAEEADAGGYLFVQKTITEWNDGTNNFSKPGEKLWGIFIADECIGIGGLNQDPYVNDKTIGRVRHLYISKKYRGLGLSKLLMQLIVNKAKENFTTLRLSTQNPVADSLYESLGFTKTTGEKVTHIMKF